MSTRHVVITVAIAVLIRMKKMTMEKRVEALRTASDKNRNDINIENNGHIV